MFYSIQHPGSIVPFSYWRSADGLGGLAALEETQNPRNKTDPKGKDIDVSKSEFCWTNLIVNFKEQEELIADWHPEPLVPINPDRSHPALNPLVIEGKVIVENLEKIIKCLIKLNIRLVSMCTSKETGALI